MNTIFKESLSDYDGPGLFIVQKGSDLYISIKILHEEDYKYIVVPVTPQQIKEAKRAKISVDTIFINSPVWYIGNFAPSGFVLFKQNSSITQLASYFDGTFYLDPEDYEDELTPCTSFLENDSHISTVWEGEREWIIKIEQPGLLDISFSTNDPDCVKYHGDDRYYSTPPRSNSYLITKPDGEELFISGTARITRKEVKK